MEDLVLDSIDYKNKNESYKKYSLLGKKSSENYLLNIISNMINNQKVFEEKLKSTDLEINLITDSDESSIDKLVYGLKLYNISFNPKRDIYKNIENYKKICLELETEDEYYKNNNIFKIQLINCIPSFHKNIQIDLSNFPFHYFDIKLNEIKKYNLKLKNKKNKFVLCIFLTQINNELSLIFENLNNIDNIFNYFENIYIIYKVETKEEILKLVKDDKICKIILNNVEKKIKLIFHITSYYNSKNKEENIYNIFIEGNKFGPDFYFILNNDNKVISISKNIKSLISHISFYIMELKKLDKEKKNYNELFKKKENKRNEKNLIFRETINFISKLKSLDYLFNFNFEISFNSILNEECNELIFKKINYIKVGGKLRTKEYKKIQNLLNLIKKKVTNNQIIEIETIDIDIDFTDMKCFKCSKIIQEKNYLYYCYICKTKFCDECIHEQLKKVGKEKYIDQKHNLLFFKTRNKNNFREIDKKKLGNNRFAESTNNNQFNTSHSAMCNGCRGGFINLPRYVCIKCRPGIYLRNGYIDYCQECIEKMCHNEKEKEKYEENSNEENYVRDNNFVKEHKILTRHKHDEHIYLFLPLEYRGLEIVDPYNDY